MTALIFIVLACFFNAVMDAVENENFFESIFDHWEKRFWYKRESWKHAKGVFGYKIDAWHLAKSAMIICFILAALTYEPMVSEFWDLLIYGAVWNISFNLFYHKLFGVK